MSETTFKVPYTTIVSIAPHTNADRLELATVYGFQVVVPKGIYKPGDRIVYVPIDSVLSEKLEARIFPPDSKIKLHNHRVRQIRIRGLASQGMIIHPKELEETINLAWFSSETDLKDAIGITKYEPPVRGNAYTPAGGRKKRDNEHFHKYNGIDNIKWFPNFFKEGEEVVIQEKLHGTNCRAGIVPFVARTWWQRIKKFLRLSPKWEFVYGSNNVEISSLSNWNGGFYGVDIYGETLHKEKIFDKIKGLKGFILYGEIIGPGIQKNYTYSFKEHAFFLFDVKLMTDRGEFFWADPGCVENFAKRYKIAMVPILYKGPYNNALPKIMSEGISVLDPNTKVREGVVIKGLLYNDERNNKRALKCINEAYLDDQSNTDFH